MSTTSTRDSQVSRESYNFVYNISTYLPYRDISYFLQLFLDNVVSEVRALIAAPYLELPHTSH